MLQRKLWRIWTRQTKILGRLSVNRRRTVMVYLDYNATTPLAPEVVDAITHALTEAWGNPSSTYKEGVAAKTTIAKARKSVASMVGAAPSDIIFTSGGTEGNNWILRSMLDRKHFDGRGDDNVRGKPHFITSNIEHDSVLLVLMHFEKMEWADVTYVPVSCASGRVNPDDVMAAIRPNTVMISIMMANNETGIIQPISEICKRVKALKREPGKTQRIFVHTDAAQAIGKIPVDVGELGVDYLTIVGHKFYGPRIGAIYASNPGTQTPLPALLFGGGQERNFRPGTENTPMIAGLGKAAELVCNNLSIYNQHMKETRDFLEERLKEVFGDGVVFNGKFTTSERLPNTCNVSFIGKDLKGHEILAKAPYVQASVGAACHSQEKPSHILLALNIPPSTAWKALRISVGRETTKEDVDEAVKALELAFRE